jgi:hypothetical protein
LKKNPPRLAQDIYNVSLYGRNATFVRALSSLLRAAGGKAFAAQHRSSARRLEGHVVGFATLVAGDFKALAFAAASCAPSAPAEIGATAIAASLATLRLAQVSLRVILLLAFGEWKRRAALGASDLYVWHVSFSLRKAVCEVLRLPFCLRAWRSSVGIRLWL